MYILYHIEGQKNRCRYLKIHLHPKQNERAIRKTKALMSKRKPEQSFCCAPTEENGCISSMQFFSRNSYQRRQRRKHTRFIHIPGCICRFVLGFCKNIKKRTETLYQSFSPFMVELPVPKTNPSVASISLRSSSVTVTGLSPELKMMVILSSYR